MPALASDIIRATRQARVVTREDAAVKAQSPNARDGLQAPEGGYFENGADAKAALALKAKLIGVFRRRFAVSAAEEVWLDPMGPAGIPTARVVDAEQSLNLDALVTSVEVDMETE
ncbi:MAG TPA: hypothetical protein VMQ93_16195, partial [Novosphingobium sp.]|nr:hypothetical protein [Novosphingobium sp.]